MKKVVKPLEDKLRMPASRCDHNRELLFDVVKKLEVLATLSNLQKSARQNGEVERATELDKQLDLAFGEKERSVGAWQEHTREHGC